MKHICGNSAIVLPDYATNDKDNEAHCIFLMLNIQATNLPQTFTRVTYTERNKWHNIIQ